MLVPLFKPVRILVLIPNLGLGGAQRAFSDQAKLFAQHYAVTECVFNLDQASAYSTDNDLCDLGVSGGGGVLDKVWHFLIRCFRLKRIKQARGVTVAISHLEGADYVNICSGVGERQVLCIHGSKLHDRNIKGFVGWLRRRVLIPIIYRRADRIVTVSTGIRAELVDELGLPASKVQVINNFFDEDVIRQQASMAPPTPYSEILDQYPVVVTACRLSHEKNLIALLEVFARVKKIVPQCKLLVIGEGEQYQILLNHCRALELPVHMPEQPTVDIHTATVVLTGFQSNPHAFIARATLFALPSLNEGFPMALGEAMICGCPVVAADCTTGPREILAPATAPPLQPIRQAELTEYGLLLPVIDNTVTREADLQVWTKTLSELLLNPSERKSLSQRASERMQSFTRERIANQWIDLVEEVRRA